MQLKVFKATPSSDLDKLFFLLIPLEDFLNAHREGVQMQSQQNIFSLSAVASFDQGLCLSKTSTSPPGPTKQ